METFEQLDATVLREFVDRIVISATEKWKKKTEAREIEIVYNFIGAFDFKAATEQTEANEKNRKTAQHDTTPFSITKTCLTSARFLLRWRVHVWFFIKSQNFRLQIPESPARPLLCR